MTTGWKVPNSYLVRAGTRGHHVRLLRGDSLPTVLGICTGASSPDSYGHDWLSTPIISLKQYSGGDDDKKDGPCLTLFVLPLAALGV